MHIDLNIFIIKLVSDLQQKSVGRHMRNSAYITTISEHYKDKLFPDGECLHATIKVAAQCISCNHIKPKNIIHMKCSLGFCCECPTYIGPDEEPNYGPNDPFVHFVVYTYQVICVKHGMIPNGSTL